MHSEETTGQRIICNSAIFISIYRKFKPNVAKSNKQHIIMIMIINYFPTMFCWTHHIEKVSVLEILMRSIFYIMYALLVKLSAFE